jgi:hypothetical protein
MSNPEILGMVRKIEALPSAAGQNQCEVVETFLIGCSD